MTTASNAILTTSIDSTGILSLGTGTTTGTTLGKSGQDTNIAGNVKTANITISNPEELNYSVQISQNSILLGTTGTNLELTQTQIKVNGSQGSANQVLKKSDPGDIIEWANPAFVPLATESLNMSSNDIHNIASLNASTTMNINGQTQFDTPPHIPDPILGNDAASKGYVDTLIGNYSGNGLSLYFNYTTTQATPIIIAVGALQQTLAPNYYTMQSVAAGTDRLISTFTTDVGYPNTLTIPVGLWSMMIWGYTTAPTGQLYYHFHLNEVDSTGNVVHQIGTSGFSSDVNAVSSTDPDAYHCSLAIVNAHTMESVNNRLQIQIYTTGSNDVSTNLFTLFGGDYYSNVTTTLSGATSLLTQNNTWTGVNNFNTGFNTTSVDSASSGNLNLGTTNSITTTLGQTVTGTTNVKGATIHVGDDTSITNVKGLRVTNIDSITAGNMSIGSINTTTINLNSKPISNLALASSQYINIGTSGSALTTPTVNQVGYVIQINIRPNPTNFGTSPATLSQSYSLPAGSWITSATAGINCTVSGTVSSNSLYIFNPSAPVGPASRFLVGNQRMDLTRTFAVGDGNMILNVSGAFFCPSETVITLYQELVYSSGTFSSTENNFCWYFMRIA